MNPAPAFSARGQRGGWTRRRKLYYETFDAGQGSNLPLGSSVLPGRTQQAAPQSTPHLALSPVDTPPTQQQQGGGTKFGEGVRQQPAGAGLLVTCSALYTWLECQENNLCEEGEPGQSASTKCD